MKYYQSNKKDVRGNSSVKIEMAKFDWEINSFTCGNGNPRKIMVSVLMIMGEARNAREFEIPKPSTINKKNIYIELLKLPPFKGSKSI